MAVDRRKKNINWYAASDDGSSTTAQATLATLMDIRDELQSLVRLANCYRIPRALDAVVELGADARRKKRAAAKRRKAARSKKK
jgi:hypothetical protein